jgi:hypothetical protein
METAVAASEFISGETNPAAHARSFGVGKQRLVQHTDGRRFDTHTRQITLAESAQPAVGPAMPTPTKQNLQNLWGKKKNVFSSGKIVSGTVISGRKKPPPPPFKKSQNTTNHIFTTTAISIPTTSAIASVASDTTYVVIIIISFFFVFFLEPVHLFFPVDFDRA